MGENKQEILNRLLSALRLTSAGSDVESLTYDMESETVTIRFENGGERKANVRMDSGIAMMRDVLNAI